jgi:hypothetical protein
MKPDSSSVTNEIKLRFRHGMATPSAGLGVALSALIAIGLYPQIALADDALEQALRAPAAALASGYLYRKYEEQMIKAARVFIEKGVKIQIVSDGGSGPITKDNIDAVEQENKTRVASYKRAIEIRGSRTIAGRYTARLSGGCLEAGSMMIAMISQNQSAPVWITQSGPDGALDLNNNENNKEAMPLGRLAIVEDSIALESNVGGPMYTLAGVASEGLIEFRFDMGAVKNTARMIREHAPGLSLPGLRSFESCLIRLSPSS